MKSPVRPTVACFIGFLVAASTALGYHYVYVHAPPLEAGEAFMAAMESGDPARVARAVVVSAGPGVDDLREATPQEVRRLIDAGFERGRILDQRKREGRTRSYHYLVYREPDGQVYALVATRHTDGYRVVIPEDPMSEGRLYLWDYTWTG